MGNRVNIVLTKFVDLNAKGEEVDTTYGIRVMDNDAQTYVNGLKKEDIFGKTPAEIVALARGIDSISQDIIDFAKDNLEGVDIGDEFHTWEDIEPKAVAP